MDFNEDSCWDTYRFRNFSMSRGAGASVISVDNPKGYTIHDDIFGPIAYEFSASFSKMSRGNKHKRFFAFYLSMIEADVLSSLMSVNRKPYTIDVAKYRVSMNHKLLSRLHSMDRLRFFN